jgi:hypothetical protein
MAASFANLGEYAVDRIFVGALSDILRIFPCLLYATEIRCTTDCSSIWVIAFDKRDLFAFAKAPRLKPRVAEKARQN